MKSISEDTDLPCAILRGLGLAVVATDHTSAIISVNSASEALLGLKAETLLGKPLNAVICLFDMEADKAMPIPSVRHFQQTREPQGFRRARLVTTPATKELPVEVAFSPLIGREDHVNGVVMVIRDIRGQLARERQAEDRHQIAAIRNIARTMGEEFNGWLISISSHAAAVAENLLPGTRAHDETLHVLGIARQAGGLVKRLLSLAGTSQQGDRSEASPVPLADVVRDAVSLARASFLGQDIQVKVTVDQPLPAVLANAAQLSGCLLSVLRNSREAMPKGGLISIEASPRKIGGKSFIALSIRDTGAGMNRETVRRVFTPFFSTKSGGARMGLGLTLVRSLVEGWGGVVQISSRVDHGTRVQLCLAPAERPTAAPAEPAIIGATILVVDDDHEVLATTRRILEGAGHKVHTCDNGPECIKMFRKDPTGTRVVIVDALMPGDGGNVLREILAIDPTASIVVTSGFPRDYVRGIIEQGAWGFAQKPLEAGQLLDATRRALEEKRTRAAENGN